MENIWQIIAQKNLNFWFKCLTTEKKENHPRHILMKNKEKEKVLQEEKKTHYTQKNKDKGGCKFSSEAMQMRRHWNKMNWKKKIVDLSLYTQGKYFSNKDKLFKS